MDCQLAGPIQNEALMRYYQQHPADLFINTSSSEGLPVSIMEACSFGIPAIATPCWRTSEIVQDGKTGFLMEFAPNVLAEQIVVFSRLPQEQRQTLRADCRKVWKNNSSGSGK